VDLLEELKYGYSTATTKPASGYSKAPGTSPSQQYEDIFAALNEKLLPALPLLHPGTRKALTPFATLTLLFDHYM
jgi:hypothetical protein